MLLIDTRKLARNIHQLIRNALQYTRTGQIISEELTKKTKEHVGQAYPNSTHWSLDKIHEGPFMNDWGSTDIDIEGADRAYHEVKIYPHGQFLTIPIHKMAYGKTASEIDGLFKPKDKNILAKVMNGSLVAVFALVRRVIQRKDQTLLPTDSDYEEAIENRWVSEWFKTMDNNENRWS